MYHYVLLALLAVLGIFATNSCSVDAAVLNSKSAHGAKKSAKFSESQLAKCLTPGIDADGNLNIEDAFRHLFPRDDEYTGKAHLYTTETTSMLCDGKPVTALLAGYELKEDNSYIAGMLSVLAFFDTTGKKPRLIDAADVSEDRFTSIATPSVIRYKPGCDAVIIENTHSNAGESFVILDAINLHRGKLHVLSDGIPLMYSARGAENGVDQHGRFLVTPNKAGVKSLSFEVKVTRQKYLPENSDKEVSAQTKTFIVPCVAKGSKFVFDCKCQTAKRYQKFFDASGFCDGDK